MLLLVDRMVVNEEVELSYRVVDLQKEISDGHSAISDLEVVMSLVSFQFLLLPVFVLVKVVLKVVWQLLQLMLVLSSWWNSIQQVRRQLELDRAS